MAPLRTDANSSSAFIMVVGTDPALRNVLTYNLGRRWSVTAVHSAEQCLSSLVPPLPAVVISDVALPGLDGLELCRRVRRDHPGLPILLLSAHAGDDDRLAGFAAGADDYVTKPFSMAELMLRVAVLSRRASGMGMRPERIYENGDLCINIDRREVTRAGRPLFLTRREFDLLSLFASSPGRVFDHAALLSQMADGGGSDSRHRLSVHIANLRRKITSDPAKLPYLVTIWGVGYKFIA